VQHNDPHILDQICSELESSSDQTVKAQSLAELIGRSRGYRWVGIYDAAGDEIAAIAWTGPDAPAIPHFPVSQGLCGAAVPSGTTVVVGDVTQDPRYSHHLSEHEVGDYRPHTAPGDAGHPRPHRC